MTREHESDFDSAERIYADYIERVSSGERLDIDDLAAAHPRHAELLRRLHSLLELGSDHPTLSFQDRLSARRGTATTWNEKTRLDPDAPPGTDSGSTPEEPRPEPRSERYEIDAEVARGGMGVIFSVRDRDLGRKLAMKVMLEEGSPSREGLDRFLEEAQVTAQLDHPSVVPVHELGFDSEGRVFFTMKLVRGEHFGKIIDSARSGLGGWNMARAVGALVKACQAVAFAHEKGVIHRDLKPSNIMLGRYGEVYVMDWGLAKITGKRDLHDIRIRPDPGVTLTTVHSTRREGEHDSPLSPIVTMDGAVVGTPVYMPPEQAEGRIEEIDTTSDVYSLGAILYELLVGKPPYVSEGARLSPRMILARVAEGPPKSVEALAPGAPPELAAICTKAMARDRRERYSSSLDLAEDLQAYLDGRVVHAYESGALAELKSWVHRNRLVAAVSLAAVLAIVALSATFMLAQKEKNDELFIANSTLDTRNARLEEQNTTIRTQAAELENTNAALKSERDAVLRLADLKRLDDRLAEADELWPCGPERAAAMRSWLAEARELGGRRELHESTLATLREQALPHGEADRQSDRRTHPLAPRLREVVARRAALETEAGSIEEVSKGDRATVVASGSDTTRPLVVYLRHRFTVAAELTIDQLDFELLVDDGAAVYLNGVEVHRVNLPGGALEDDTRALTSQSEPLRHRFSLEGEALAHLRPAENQLAVRLHQGDRKRADLFFDLTLSAGGPQLVPAPLVPAPLVPTGSTWHYHAAPAPPLWHEPGFDDAGWPAGPAPLGHGFKAGPGRARELRIRVSELEVETRRLEEAVAERRTWRFADDETDWRHELLVGLVAGLEKLPATVAAVSRRLEFAERVVERTSQHEAWEDAIASVANESECPLYGGFELPRQMGLVPVGRDPRSGLWEFAHAQSGRVPARDASTGELEIEDDTCIVLVLIPGGSFRMGAERPTESTPPGSPNIDPLATGAEGKIHRVELDPFFIAKFEMTQAQWLSQSRWLATPVENPSRHKNKRVGTQRIGPRNPVEQINWFDCETALRRLDLELPTEAQWEHAARAGTTTVWYTGDLRESLVGHANLADQAAKRAGAPWSAIKDWPELDDGHAAHAPVGSFAPNPWGLHDAHGNLWEWTRDRYGSYDLPVRPGDGLRIVPEGGAELRAPRGGSFMNPARSARVSYRGNYAPSIRVDALGVRPARAVRR